MDYKKIISRDLRRKILRCLSFVPDKLMLKIQYRLKTGRKLNLKNPERFTEKIQWYKLYYKNPLLIQCVDKYDVRNYVKSKGLEDILIPCYGVFDYPDDIDWTALPEQFVVKDTLGGGGNSVVIVGDKSTFDVDCLKKKTIEWVTTNVHKKADGREWPYYRGKKHRIIIEEYLHFPESNAGLIDYKFFCFGGKIAYIQVMTNRENGKSVNCTLYDENFNRLSARSLLHDVDEQIIEKPIGFNRAKKIAEVLSKDFPHVRVDLYIDFERVYFGELTFFGASGYYMFEPDSFDFEIGKQFMLPFEKQ